MAGKILQLRQAKKYCNATSRSKGRRGNDAYRVRGHLTEAEMDKLLAVLKCNRHGQRGWLIGLVIYRHGLRVSEACDLRWDDIDLPKRTNWCRSVPGPISVPVPVPIRPPDWPGRGRRRLHNPGLNVDDKKIVCR